MQGSKGRKPAGKKTKSPRKKRVEEEVADVADVQEEPHDGAPEQVELTEAELNEEITKTLTTGNPNAPHNVISFNYKVGCFQSIPLPQMIEHLVLESNMIPQSSKEVEKLRAMGVPLIEPETPVDQDKAQSTGKDEDEEEEEEEVAPDKEAKVVNQFNFTERATQTLSKPSRDYCGQNQPPLCNNFSAMANKWKMNDAYENERRKQRQKETPTKEDAEENKKAAQAAVDVLETWETVLKKPEKNLILRKTAKLSERCVSQVMFDEIAKDYKFFEDPADEFKGLKGTLLPLWKFSYDKAKGLSVTALCWSNKYHDLFAVGMGSCDFLKQGQGMLLIFTLKNPSYPEYIYQTDSTVTSLDIHKKRSQLVAVGCYDGSMAVYDLKENQLVSKSFSTNGQHAKPVWQVCWQEDDVDKNSNFTSVSSDGQVMSWTLSKDKLVSAVILTLAQQNAFSQKPQYEELNLPECGTALDFHRETDSLLLVGTEDGTIHKYSKLETHCARMETYRAHNLAVNTVKWNSYHSEAFISCSSDWTVAVWDHLFNTPMLRFNLEAPVTDVAWSPYSSTIFAAVTTDGLVHVFDLSLDKVEAICQQQVVPKKKAILTYVEFHPVDPIILVGDDRGFVSSFKLSPNLRSKPKAKKGKKVPEGPEVEVAKMEKILSLLKKSKESLIL